MIFIWINKRNWKTPGPIVNVAVHNAYSFSDIGFETHFCVGAGEGSDTHADLEKFYGLKPNPHFHIHRIRRWHKGGSTYSIPIFFYALRLIRTLCRKDQVTVITRESGFLWFLVWLRRHPKISGYYELHDFYADLSWMEKTKGEHRREKIYEHLFLPRMDGLICITHTQQDLYRRVFPGIPSCAFPLGTAAVNHTADPEQRRRRRTLVYVGHMHDEKGLNFLLRVSAKLSVHRVKLLFLGGKDSEIPHLWEKSRKMGIENNVKFLPFAPPEDMHRLVSEKAAAGVVMLKDTYYNRYLTCPVKALDYLSHGLPAIGSDLPSVREVMGSACRYVLPDDEDRFVEAVLQVLDSPEIYRHMSLMAEERAKELSWENRARGIADFVTKNISCARK
ncbi:MAG: glycosyltransferase family 4 protein [Desulfococcaceae bacterium]